VTYSNDNNRVGEIVVEQHNHIKCVLEDKYLRQRKEVVVATVQYAKKIVDEFMTTNL
jgi:hypothetical protein